MVRPFLFCLNCKSILRNFQNVSVWSWFSFRASPRGRCSSSPPGMAPSRALQAGRRMKILNDNPRIFVSILGEKSSVRLTAMWLRGKIRSSYLLWYCEPGRLHFCPIFDQTIYAPCRDSSELFTPHVTHTVLRNHLLSCVGGSSCSVQSDPNDTCFLDIQLLCRSI